MPEDVHPGSFVGDTIEEFKKLPTWGKFAIAGVGVVVVFLVIRARSASTTAPADQSAAAQGPSSPFPMVGNVPLLPSGTNPIYDPSGNLVGYQPTNTNQQPPPAQGGNPPTQGQLNGPLIPFGQYNGPSYSNLKPNTYYNYQGVNYRLIAGGSGRLWGVNPSGQQILLYGPQSAYGTGGGPDSTQSFMGNPMLYRQSITPHISSAHRGKAA